MLCEVGTETRNVERRRRGERVPNEMPRHELPPTERGEFTDGRTVPGHDEGLTFVERTHDLATVVAKFALCDPPSHGTIVALVLHARGRPRRSSDLLQRLRVDPSHAARQHCRMETREDDLLWGCTSLGDGPDWKPLTDLLGEHLSTFFRWLHVIEFFDEGIAHAYRHEATGRFLDIHEDGRTLRCVGGSAYAVAHPIRVVGTAFAGWESRGPQDRADDTMQELRRLHRQLAKACGPAPELEPWPEGIGVPAPQLGTTPLPRGSTSATVRLNDVDSTKDVA